ncbi:hypothetical protein D9V41_07245 [Aeromicrobium phragmitis]|uniref:Solute-binding protein family 5 domain-containing protein n=1 Tax=Aeromicrobium phragmitis TaxID=2478914 RepID=A0A3L8PNF5_9ACTN|nr:ABC transporter substrate-binding protein [Aeromicrobium phragmitis]RLV56223.1 hypothetical protein D9V41_07245 [Aeromicrobium phragmitis]
MNSRLSTVWPAKRLRTAIAASAVSALLLAGCSSGSADSGEQEASTGGTLTYALGADLPTLDVQQTTAGVVATVAYNVVEFLFVRDADGENAPMLAEDVQVSEDGLTWTITLREGVTFHNGETMTSADVLASYERWSRISSSGGEVASRLANVETPDDQTIVFTFDEPYGSFLSAISINTQGLAIYPASVLEQSTDTELAELVGTGPYMLEEHDPGRSVRLVRFEDYSALPGDEPDGYGGHKPQHLDAIEFQTVSNEGSRLAGLQTGEYDVIHGSSADALETLEGTRGLVVERVDPTGLQVMLVNNASPITSDLKLRQGIQAALDHEEILTAGLGAGNFRIDPSISLQETAWHSTVGEDHYNMDDPDLAEQLIADSDYNGETIRIVTSRDLERFYNQAVVVEQQLESVGLDVEVETYDWATALEHRENEAAWELFISDFGIKYDPVEQPFMRLCSYVGWWCDDEAVAIVDGLISESDEDKRREFNDAFQEAVYEQVPFIKIGDTGGVIAHRDRVHGVTRQGGSSILAWNVWIEE